MERLLINLCVVLVSLLLVLSTAHAKLIIQITEGIEGALPIAIVPFKWESAGQSPKEIVSDIVREDLRLSGRFNPFPEKDFLARPYEGTKVNFLNWRILKVDYLLIGKMRATNAGGIVVQFQLFDVFKGKQLAGYSIPSKSADLRYVAHQISDIVYETVTGDPGAFNTRIAYITLKRGEKGKNKYTLRVADADAANPQVILKSSRELLSPSWSPDGRRLAYVSFEKNSSQIFVQEVYESGRRFVITASRNGSYTGAPAWSPDGRYLAYASSDRGSLDIYIYDFIKQHHRRLTKHWGIETEPVWAPDGKSIVFTSDRSNNPQLYQISINGGRPKRLTYEGEENARASFSPDGKMLTFVHRRSGTQYSIAILEVDSGNMRVLTEPNFGTESPSFAPNGSRIIYATNSDKRGVLSWVSVDGRLKHKVYESSRQIREPAWSPFYRNF